MVKQVVNALAVHEVLTSPTGGVAKDLLRRGIRVQTQARRNLGGSTGTGPKRIDTGLLRASISTQLRQNGPESLAVRIGTNVFYAIWIHEGTGIYGPRKTPIVPKTARYLRFKPKGADHYIYRKSVKGIRPNPFLVAALSAAKAGPGPKGTKL